MKKSLLALSIVSALCLSNVVKAEAPDVQPCDCEFAGLKIAYAKVKTVWQDSNGIYANTYKASDGNTWTVELIPQYNENFEQMVDVFTDHEVAIGYVEEGEDTEVTWTKLTSAD
jgi:hypothetical protein